VFIGDNRVGKTSLLITYTTQKYPENLYIPAVYESYATIRQVDGRNVCLSLWDTVGGEECDRLRPLVYPQTDVFVLCFSVADPSSYEHVRTKWYPETAHHFPSAPILLVGTKIDLRDDAATVALLHDRRITMLQHHQGYAMAKDIGAVCYMECSARAGYGVQDVFEEAMRIAANPSARRVRATHTKCVIT
ncbi:Ras-related C3 botulinum toxin substrate 1, partial [Psilocybe cubensis]